MATKPTIEGLEEWDVEIEEVSADCYRTCAVRRTGNLFEESGNGPDGFIERLKEFEHRIQQALEGKKLEASS
jgi:hypothetical protein